MDIVKALVLPPGLPLLIAFLGLLLALRWRRVGVALLVIAVLSLYLLSIPPVSRALLINLEFYPPLPQTVGAAGHGAIVVLGAGRYPHAPEYQGDTVNAIGLERLRYAARLRRITGLPLLVSGGSVHGDWPPEAKIMNQVLQADFGGGADWQETLSKNTLENADYSAQILKGHGIHSIYLVTSAVHMRRAVWAFQRQGLTVTPAPTVYGKDSLDEVHTPWFIPAMPALIWSRRALYEDLGMWWYDLRY